MSSRYIELKDNIIVEVGSPGEPRTEMSGGVLDRVDTTVDQIGQIVERIVRPIGETLSGLYDTLNVPIKVDKAEVELGLSFSAEGNIFVAKAKTEGSLSVKISFIPAS